MVNNLLSKIGAGISLVGVLACGPLVNESKADRVKMWSYPDNDLYLQEELYGSSMEISHKEGGLEGYDSGDLYWKDAYEGSGTPPGPGSDTSWSRVASDKANQFYNTEGFLLKEDNRSSGGKNPFPLVADIQNAPDGGLTSTGNQFVLEVIDGPDELRPFYDWEINFDPDKAQFQDGTHSKSGTWDLSSATPLELPKYDTFSASGQYMTGSLTPVPEPTTFATLAAIVATSSVVGSGRKRHSKKNRR